MARTRRLWSPEHYDHVVIRGNNRQNIFGKAEDVFYWFQILDDIYLEHSFTVAAYCIMTNHVHLLIEDQKLNIGKLINLKYKKSVTKPKNKRSIEFPTAPAIITTKTQNSG